MHRSPIADFNAVDKAVTNFDGTNWLGYGRLGWVCVMGETTTVGKELRRNSRTLLGIGIRVETRS